MSFFGIRTTMSRKTQTTWALGITIGIIFLTLAFLRTHQRQEYTSSSPSVLKLPQSSTSNEGVKVEIDKTNSPTIKIEEDKPSVVAPKN